MTVTTVQAGGVTTPDDWSLSAGSSKWAAVNRPDDDASSYIQSPTTSGTYQYFTCSPGLSVGDTITQIVVRSRARRGGANDCTFRIGYQFTPQVGGTQTGESAAGALEAVNAWTELSYTHSGLSTVWGSNLVFWIRNTQGRIIHLTSFDLEITYTPVAGGGVAGKAHYYAQLMGA